MVPGQGILRHTLWLPGFKQLAQGSAVGQSLCFTLGEERRSPEGTESGPAEATWQAGPNWLYSEWALEPRLPSAVPIVVPELREPPPCRLPCADRDADVGLHAVL